MGKQDCQSDRDHNSLGCGICITKNGKFQSAKHGSNKCGDCDEHGSFGFATTDAGGSALAAFGVVVAD